jgi:hypothetical protein
MGSVSLGAAVTPNRYSALEEYLLPSKELRELVACLVSYLNWDFMPCLHTHCITPWSESAN